MNMQSKLEKLNIAITAMNQRDSRPCIGPEYQVLHGMVQELDAEFASIRDSFSAMDTERNSYRKALEQIVEDYDTDYQGERSLALTAQLALKRPMGR